MYRAKAVVPKKATKAKTVAASNNDGLPLSIAYVAMKPMVMYAIRSSAITLSDKLGPLMSLRAAIISEMLNTAKTR